MTTSADAGAANVWAAIEEEKQRDRFVRRVSATAWIVTFLLVVVVGAMVGATVVHVWKLVQVGAAPWSAVYDVAMPFLIVAGVVSLLVASLSTVGVFLRMRTTTLSEIQLRLATLERMLAARPDGE